LNIFAIAVEDLAQSAGIHTTYKKRLMLNSAFENILYESMQFR